MFTFGITHRDADCTADNIAFHDGCPTFDVVIHGKPYAHVELKVAGKHNILNALAAAAAAYVLASAAGSGAGTFHLPRRRTPL